MIKTMRIVTTYCCDTQSDVDEAIKKEEQHGTLIKKTVEIKQKKSKGEIIAEKLRLITTVDYDTDWFDLEEEGD